MDRPARPAPRPEPRVPHRVDAVSTPAVRGAGTRLPGPGGLRGPPIQEVAGARHGAGAGRAGYASPGMARPRTGQRESRREGASRAGGRGAGRRLPRRRLRRLQSPPPGGAPAGEGHRLLPAAVPPDPGERRVVGAGIHRMDQRGLRQAPVRRPSPAAAPGRSRVLRPAGPGGAPPAGRAGPGVRDRRILLLLLLVRGPAPAGGAARRLCRRRRHRLPVLHLLGQRELDAGLERTRSGRAHQPGAFAGGRSAVPRGRQPLPAARPLHPDRRTAPSHRLSPQPAARRGRDGGALARLVPRARDRRDPPSLHAVVRRGRSGADRVRLGHRVSAEPDRRARRRGDDAGPGPGLPGQHPRLVRVPGPQRALRRAVLPALPNRQSGLGQHGAAGRRRHRVGRLLAGRLPALAGQRHRGHGTAHRRPRPAARVRERLERMG